VSELSLTLGQRDTTVSIETVVVAGWAGRDRAAVEKHIAELEAIGVRRPSTVPIFYRVSASRLTTASEIESTAGSGGEVEAVLLRAGGSLWVGVGSDHTDREVESYSVAVSKQLCDKPIAQEFWPYDDVAGHWDLLTLRSWIDNDVLYQEGTTRELLHPDDLLRGAQLGNGDRTLMFCGTVPAIGPIRAAARFRYELSDPVLNRKIVACYSIRALPLIS
jgi:hypothetical protein